MSTTPLPIVDHRTLPRKKRAPSLRDQAILVAYRVEGRTQAALAEDNRLSQSRISAIIRRVERWRADLIPAAENELDFRQRERLERWLERERLQAIHTRAMRTHDSQVLELKTLRKVERDGRPFKETTRRQQAASAQFLKVALRATTDIGRLNDKPPVEKQDATDAHSRWWQTHALLCQIRRAARAAGKLGPADSRESAIVQDWMKALAGDRGAGVSPAVTPFDDSDERCAQRSADTRGSNVQLASSSSNCTNPAAPITPNAPPIESPEEASEVVTPSDVPTPELARSGALIPHSAAPQKKKPAEQLPLSLAERRRLHDLKLQQRREAQRSGLPVQFVFDPADGPVPRPELQIDDFGYVPSPPDKQAEAERLQEYLALVRAQNEANNRRCQEADAQTRS